MSYYKFYRNNSANYFLLKELDSMLSCSIESSVESQQEISTALAYNNKILLNAHPEGYIHFTYTDAESVIMDLFKDTPLEDLYILSGSCDDSLLENAKLKQRVAYGPLIYNWIFEPDNLPEVVHTKEEKEKTFLSLNRVVRSHRAGLVVELYKRNLVDLNFLSFSKTASHAKKDQFSGSLYRFSDREKEYQEIEKTIPAVKLVDDVNLNENQATTISPFEFYKKSLFSLVSETFFFEGEVFLSEKIYKPILHSHPFIVLGPAGTLAELKRQGFMTFGKWFNESYDSISDPIERFDAVINEVERVCKLPWEAQLKIFEESKYVVDHNRKVLLNPDFDKRNVRNLRLYTQLQSEKTYTVATSPSASFINYNNLDSTIKIIDGRIDAHLICNEVQNSINNPKYSLIVIDNTKEYFNSEIYTVLREIDDLSKVVAMGMQYSHTITDDEHVCLRKGIRIRYDQYFVKHRWVYNPISTADVVEKKIFTLMTGKSRLHRTAVIGMLADRNLLQYGHVSYFGDDIDKTFDNNTIESFFSSNAPDHIKSSVRRGLEQIKLPLVLDVEKFNYSVSHSYKFPRTYYDACEFAVELETNFDRDWVPAITEKSIKPYLCDKKYMILGQVNHTQVLIDYLTKSEQWNKEHIDSLLNWQDYTKYDTCKDHWQRLEIFVDQIETQIYKHLEGK